MMNWARDAVVSLAAVAMATTTTAGFLQDSMMHGGGGGGTPARGSAIDHILFSPHEPYTVDEGAFELTAAWTHASVDRVNGVEVDDDFDLLNLATGVGLSSRVSLAVMLPIVLDGIDSALDTNGRLGDVGLTLRCWPNNGRAVTRSTEWGLGAGLRAPTGQELDDAVLGDIGPGSGAWVGSVDLRLGWHNATGTRRVYARAGGERELDENEQSSLTGLVGIIWNRHGFGQDAVSSNTAAWATLASTRGETDDGREYWAEQLRFGVGWTQFDAARAFGSLSLSSELVIPLDHPPTRAPTRLLIALSLLFEKPK